MSTALDDALTVMGGQPPRRGGVRLATFDKPTRRRIRRALSRGTALEQPDEARVAMAIARRKHAALERLRWWMPVTLLAVTLLMVQGGVDLLGDGETLRGMLRLAFAAWMGWLAVANARARRVLPRAQARNAAVLERIGLPLDEPPGRVVTPTPQVWVAAAVLGFASYGGIVAVVWIAFDTGTISVGQILTTGAIAGVAITAGMLALARARLQRETARA